MSETVARICALFKNEIVVKVIVPLAAPLIAIGALYYAISSESAEIRRELSYERESRVQSVVGVSLFAESLMKPIVRSYWVAYSTTKQAFPDDSFVADEATVLLYKKTIEKLCDAISADHSINYLFYSRMSFASDLVAISNSDYLAQNCARSRKIKPTQPRAVIGDETSQGNGTVNTSVHSIEEAIDLREMQDVSEVYLFLKSIRYFFESDDCSRLSLYEDMEGLADQVKSKHLVSQRSTAYVDIVECQRTVMSVGWKRSGVAFSEGRSRRRG